MYQVFVTARFRRELKKILRKYPRFEEDVNRLIDLLSLHPQQGDHLGAGLFKVRVLITGKPAGKSYGARVIHLVISSSQRVHLLAVYDKSEKDNLTKSEIKELHNFVQFLKK